MNATRTHPRYRLDDTIHAPVRLSIMSTLASAERVDFRFLRDLLEVSDSLLSKHMAHLEEAGYVMVIKGYHGKRPRTWYGLSDAGRSAFEGYLAALHEIVDTRGATTPGQTRRRGPARPRPGLST